jgi:hypothetical protein
MKPWFAPLQIITALGVTVPVFIVYAWRIYQLILKHQAAFRLLGSTAWLDEILEHGWTLNDVCAEMTLNNVLLRYDQALGVIRRNLRADVYIIVLIGFIGTLFGMITAFTTLLMSVGKGGLEPSVALTALLSGGLSTALISSLVAALMACIIMAFLTFSEGRVAALKSQLNSLCLDRYRIAIQQQAGEGPHD